MKRLLIIPAAGAGTRLGSAVPKLLVPVNGRPMIDHIFTRYAPFVDRFVVVVSPTAEDAIRRHGSTVPVPMDIVVQHRPTGMLDAILLGTEAVRAHDPAAVWITWCDQIAVRDETVQTLAALSVDSAGVVCPTVRYPDPYIHLVRDATGVITSVLQKREGDPMPPFGEGDLGLFHLSRDVYLTMLPLYASSSAMGRGTGERNFLPFLAWLQGRAPVVTFPCVDVMEAVGINTPDELERVSAYLHHAN